jgi:hypothetical protein
LSSGCFSISKLFLGCNPRSAGLPTTELEIQPQMEKPAFSGGLFL